MASSVASKNLFELLGNDAEEEASAPVQPVDKPNPRAGKRNVVSDDAPKASTESSSRGGQRGDRGGRGGRDNKTTGSEQAFQDRDVGRNANRGKSTDEGGRSDRQRGDRNQREGGFEGRGRGRGRGGRGGQRDDRHSRTAVTDSQKQADHGWGDQTGVGEWNDEKAGEQIAQEEEKQGFDTWTEDPVNAEGEKPETTGETGVGDPDAEEKQEDKSRSYAEYLAEQAEKRLNLGGSLTARKANEGTSKKMPEGKEFARDEEEAYFVGSGGKKQRERQHKEKNTLVLDHDMLAKADMGGRGGGRGGRGGRGRGEGGGFRGGEGRGRGGRGRGDFRGGRGRGGPSANVNVSDESAFPILGGGK